MKTVVGIKFKQDGKTYFFDPCKLELKKGDKVVAQTAMGDEVGEVVVPSREINEKEFGKELKNIIRIATNKDLKNLENAKKKEKEAFDVCLKKIKKYDLPMELVEVDFKFDSSKAIFYFVSDNRVDFRELVKDLASVYKTRIEMRQIGVRDQVKRIGGNGICGRQLCCCSFLNNFDGVSIKMAKEQNASLNPSKISGCCGRLMCCLKYEQNVYEEKNKKLPHVGDIVETEDGEGSVVEVETLKEIVRVQFKNDEGSSYKKYDASEVKIIKTADKNKKVNSEEELENLKELEKLEKLEKEEKKNISNNN